MPPSRRRPGFYTTTVPSFPYRSRRSAIPRTPTPPSATPVHTTNFTEYSLQLFNTLSQSRSSDSDSRPTYTYHESTGFFVSDEPSPSVWVAFGIGNRHVQNEQTASAPDGDDEEDGIDDDDEEEVENEEERLLTIERELEARMWVLGDDDIDHVMIDEDEREVCAICLDELSEEVEMTKLDCKHKYHLHCIKNWLIKKNFCPLCKTKAIPSLIS